MGSGRLFSIPSPPMMADARCVSGHVPFAGTPGFGSAAAAAAAAANKVSQSATAGKSSLLFISAGAESAVLPALLSALH